MQFKTQQQKNFVLYYTEKVFEHQCIGLHNLNYFHIQREMKRRLCGYIFPSSAKFVYLVQDYYDLGVGFPSWGISSLHNGVLVSHNNLVVSTFAQNTSETNLMPPFFRNGSRSTSQVFWRAPRTPAPIQCCSTGLEGQCRILVLARDNEVYINSVDELCGNTY